MHNATLRPRRSPLAAPELGKGAPTVSVVIPMSDAVDTVEETVASVWGQKDVRTEVILVDDMSRDATLVVAMRLADRGPARVIANTRKIGFGMSRHKGVLAARSDVISTVEADGVLYPEKLAAEIDAIAGRKRTVAFSSVEYGRKNTLSRWDFDAFGALEKPDRLGFVAGRQGHFPREITYCRQLYDRTHGFDGILPMYEDWTFMIELAAVAETWVNTGILGTRYEHARTSPAPGDPSKHRFFVHAAFLKHADLMALHLGAQAVEALSAATTAFGALPAAVADGIDALRDRTGFAGNPMADLRALRHEVHKLVFRDDLAYDTRLEQGYGAVLSNRDAR